MPEPVYCALCFLKMIHLALTKGCLFNPAVSPHRQTAVQTDGVGLYEVCNVGKTDGIAEFTNKIYNTIKLWSYNVFCGYNSVPVVTWLSGVRVSPPRHPDIINQPAIVKKKHTD